MCAFKGRHDAAATVRVSEHNKDSKNKNNNNNIPEIYLHDETVRGRYIMYIYTKYI